MTFYTGTVGVASAFASWIILAIRRRWNHRDCAIVIGAQVSAILTVGYLIFWIRSGRSGGSGGDPVSLICNLTDSGLIYLIITMVVVVIILTFVRLTNVHLVCFVQFLILILIFTIEIIVIHWIVRTN